MSQLSIEQFPLRLSECKKPLLKISSSKNPSLISEIPFIDTQNVAVMAPAMCFVCNKEDKVHFMFSLDPSKLRRWCIILKCQIPGTDTGARKSGPRLCSDYFSPSDLIEPRPKNLEEKKGIKVTPLSISDPNLCPPAQSPSPHTVQYSVEKVR